MTHFKAQTFVVPVLLLILLAIDSALGAGELTKQATTTQQDPKCLLPMEPGPCRMSLERYYYNAKTNTCETFKFGGCRGNDNKFGFRQTCEEACMPAIKATTKAPVRSSIEATTKAAASRITTKSPIK